MTNKKAIDTIEEILTDYPLTLEEDDALKFAISAIERDSKVDDITYHWNGSAFEDILKVYERGVTE